jgi:flavodoxin
MNSLVIYASRSGNTQRIAEAIAEELRRRGPVELLVADEAPATVAAGTDLVVIGGPTEAHGMTPPMTQLFDRFSPGTLAGMPAAAFDTRLRWPLLLSGSAATRIADRLRHGDARLIGDPESFFVTRQPMLEVGELERAKAWAGSVAAAVEAGIPRHPVGSAAG